MTEADLYLPVKDYLQGLGFTVRGEVGKCDAVAVMDETVIAVELKLTLGLPVLYQAIQRLAGVDAVYVAVPVPGGDRARSNWDARVPDAVRLCRMLGLGLMAVRDGLVTLLCDPSPYQPRKVPKARAKLLGEFRARSGDHNVGGTTKRPRVTAYREAALRCALLLSEDGAASPAALRARGQPKAAGILRDNVYGWFSKVARGVYTITPDGEEALLLYCDVVHAQRRTATLVAAAPTRVQAAA